MRVRKVKKRTINDEIDRLCELLSKTKPGTQAYLKISENLQSLCDSRSFKAHSTVTMDTVILAVTNIVGLLLVLNYEQLHVVSGRALEFVLKRRA